MPILTHASLAAELYRAACCLTVGTYWGNLLRSVIVILQSVPIKHNRTPDPADQRVAYSMVTDEITDAMARGDAKAAKAYQTMNQVRLMRQGQR